MVEPAFPSIRHKEREFYQVGCKKCGEGEFNFCLYFDGKKEFVVRCKCGYVRDLSIKEVVDYSQEKR